jgi:hypothetical protein
MDFLKNNDMKMVCIFLISVLIYGIQPNYAQDLDSLLNNLSKNDKPDFTIGTFKGTRIINGQSVEIPASNDLTFFIAHRFGQINMGIYDFFGLDKATNRIGFEYGFKDRVGLSVGRNSYEKTYDGSVKIKIFKQQSGNRNIPVTVSFYSAVFVTTLKWEIPERDNLFSSRLSYVNQILLARKITKNLSIQLSPTLVHKNLVERQIDQNNIYAAGLGGRYKISRKISINGEYFYLLPGQTADDFKNSLSFGFDFETGGHIFQLLFSNSTTMFERNFITETTGDWKNGGICFGFNLFRVFPLNKNRKNIY